MTLEEVKSIYLGRSRSFPNGDSAIPILNSLHNKDFLKALGKTQDEFTSFWNIRQFTGKGNYPREFANDQEVLHWISTHRDGIGFVNKNSIGEKGSQAKIVLTLPLSE